MDFGTIAVMHSNHLDAKTRSRISSALRKAWRYGPERKAARARQRIRRGVYVCEECNGEFGQKEIQVDHIVPVGSFPGSRNATDETWSGVFERLWCGPEGLQILCKPCHKEKTHG